MADLKLSMTLPSGEVKKVELPDDVLVKELLPELVTSLSLSTTGSDGRPLSYRLMSKALGRVLKDDETFAAAAVPAESPVIVEPIIVAGA